ncbi:non-classical arabinogalactan protein 31-like [Cucurbita moschata]|uniref:Non-classical arabinogalactan protein 31-like n=1 Tax=Cucurbita moschata TaxID=3662 RepID=A0A6J1EHN2_CUCMO|nr:non-classical arabinogalactan protein 31-like [Cucurbita moschata]
MGSVATGAVIVLLLGCALNAFQAAASHGSPTLAPRPDDRHYPVPVAAPSHHHHHHHHHHPPSQSPIYHHHSHSPAPSPVYAPPPPAHYAPVPSPVQPPKRSTYIPRSFVEVQGVVYCKSCHYPGVDTLLGAKPLNGATVKLSCKNTKYAPTMETATTDKNGYFRLAAPKNVTSYAFHRCKVYLVKSPDSSCNKMSKMNGGEDGAELKPAKAFTDAEKKPVVLYNVGPLAFEPTCAR